MNTDSKQGRLSQTTGHRAVMVAILLLALALPAWAAGPLAGAASTHSSVLANVAASASPSQTESSVASWPSVISPGSISGTITDANTSVGLPGVCVNIEGGPLSVNWSMDTSASGTYQFTGLAPGNYHIDAQGSCLGALPSPYGFRDVPYQVSVQAGLNTPRVDLALFVVGSISGTVSVSGSNSPVQGACVSVKATEQRFMGPDTSTTTAADGTYTISGAPPEPYYVSVDPTCNGTIASGYASQTLPSTVMVTSGATTTGTDFSLVEAGEITGTVTDSNTHDGLGICMSASLGGLQPVNIESESNGNFTFEGLYPGNYSVTADPSCGGSVPSDYKVTWMSAITVTSGAVSSGNNFGVSIGGSISGFVTDASTSAGVKGACVQTLNPDQTASQIVATTAANGSYTIPGLYEGYYNIKVDPTCGGSQSSTHGIQILPRLIHAVEGATSTGANVALTGVGSFTGTITDEANGALVGGACISYGYGDVDNNVVTSANGTFLVPSLSPGTYGYDVDPSCGGTKSSPYSFRDLPYRITVVAGLNTPKIDLPVRHFGSLSGTVFNAISSAPVAGVCVSARGVDQRFMGPGTTVQSAVNGRYTISGIPPGRMRIEVDPTCGGSNPSPYAAQTLAYLVRVDSGVNVVGVNIALVTAGTISGTVTEHATGSGVEGICVVAIVNSKQVASATTVPDGTYSISNLAPGSYAVAADPSCSGNQYVPLAPLELNSLVPVSASGTTSGVNFSLVVGGSISGIITDAATSSPLGLVCVNAIPLTGDLGAGFGASTGANGSYTIENLATGSYVVSIDPTCARGQPMPNAPRDLPTPVTVTAGTSTNGINASLLLNGVLQGVVLDALTKAPLGGVCVSADSATKPSQFAWATVSNGLFRITDLAPGTYSVSIDPTCEGTKISTYAGLTLSTSVVISSGATANVGAVGLKSGSNVTVSSNYSPSLFGQLVTLTASVAPTDNGGAITFFNNGSALGACIAKSLTAGRSTCAISNLSVGTHAIRAVYSGDARFGASTSAAFSQVVNRAATSTRITLPGAAYAFGHWVTFVATVSPSDNGGSVAFFDNAVAIASCASRPLSSNVATCTVNDLSTGWHLIRANYSGDGSYLSSNSSNGTQLINRDSTDTQVFVPGSTVMLGQMMTLVARVAPTDDAGGVTFFNNGAPISVCVGRPLVAGQAICNTTLAVGPHTIVAGYTGDANYVGSSSSPKSVTVNRAATLAKVTTSGTPSKLNQWVAFTATVSPTDNQGSVTFYNNGSVIPSCVGKSLSGGISQCVIPNLTLGAHSIWATYSGDGNYLGSSSSWISQVVNRT